MKKRGLILKVLALVLLAWGAVWAVRTYAGTQRVTAENLEAEIERAGFEDWSEREQLPSGATAERREERLREVADMVNQLDFAQREQMRDQRTGERFFRRLARPEKELFIDLTLEKSMETFMQAVDAMPPEERRRFVEDGLREIEAGRTQEEMTRVREMSEDLLTRISSKGMEAYFQEASAETKLDLAPLMEAMDEVMKGMRRPELGGGQR